MDHLDVTLIKMLASSSFFKSLQQITACAATKCCCTSALFKLLGWFCWTVTPWSTMNQVINYCSSVHDPLENSEAPSVMMASESVPGLQSNGNFLTKRGCLCSSGTESGKCWVTSTRSWCPVLPDLDRMGTLYTLFSRPGASSHSTCISPHQPHIWTLFIL